MATVQDPTHPTGVAVVSGGESQAISPRMRKAEAALDLKIRGESWEDIATVLGYPDGRRAQVAVEQALQKQVNEDEDIRKQMRDITGRRLERLLRSLWDKAVNEPVLDEETGEPKKDDDGNLIYLYDDVQMTAQQRILAIIDRHAKLYGLDAPAEFHITTPTSQQLEHWAATQTQSAASAVQEADIFDIDVEEEDEDGVIAIEAPKADD